MKARKNLTVLVRAQATRIMLEGTRAVGVEYLRNGKIERVRADREVILSAGTYKSPQLLMLSGIGPADQLRSVGVDVVHDLEGVGENLQEHPNLLNIYRAKGKLGLSRYLRLDRATIGVMRWAVSGEGPFATAGTMANIFTRTRPELRRPDIQIIAMPVHQHAQLWFPGMTKPPVYAFTARVGVLHALSRGWVRLRSADPLDHPRIRLNMFTEQPDMDAMIKAVRLSRELFDQLPMRELVAEELLPGPRFQTDAELAQAVREQAEHRHHAVGTCRMGTDDNAVVDAQLRVRGIDNLRVADASVLPEDPSGNTNVPTLMVGEKAADLVRGQFLGTGRGLAGRGANIDYLVIYLKGRRRKHSAICASLQRYCRARPSELSNSSAAARFAWLRHRTAALNFRAGSARPLHLHGRLSKNDKRVK